DTCKPADFRHRGVPIAALADCQFQLVLSGGRGSRKERQRPKRVNERRFPHRESSLTFYRLSDDLWFFAGALKRRFTTATKASPFRCLRHDPLVGTDGCVRDVRFGAPNPPPAIAHGASRLHHQAPERHHRYVAGADTLPGAVTDRTHRFPHSDVLIRYATDAGEITLFHRRAVLMVEIVTGAHCVEIAIDVDAPLQHVKFAPRVGVNARLVRAAPGYEVKDCSVIVLRG